MSGCFLVIKLNHTRNECILLIQVLHCYTIINDSVIVLAI